MAPFIVAAFVAAGLFGSGTTAKIIAPTDATVQKVGTVLQVAGVGTLVGGAVGSAIGAASSSAAVASLATPVTLGAVAGGVAGGAVGNFYVKPAGVGFTF